MYVYVSYKLGTICINPLHTQAIIYIPINLYRTLNKVKFADQQ